MSKFTNLAGAALLWAFAVNANAVVYDISGEISGGNIGAYLNLGLPNVIVAGSFSISGTVETDSDSPGYTITGGTVTLAGTVDLVPLLGLNLAIDVSGTPDDSGLVFTSGTICVSQIGASDCSTIDLTIGGPGVDDPASLNFSSNALFLGAPINGIRLTGGLGGENFTVTQPGGVAAILGPNPEDAEKAIGIIALGGNDVALLVGGDISFVAQPIDTRPNIVVILADDLSNDATKTLLDGGYLPNIQTYLIDGGVSFSNAFVTNPECCPSRATFLTGQYSHNHLVVSNHAQNPTQGGIAWPGWLPASGQPGKEGATVATWLQDAGYRTGFIGKYLNGYGKEAPANVIDPQTYIPAGWTDWNALISSSTYRVFDYNINENGSVVHYGEAEEEYQTDILAGHATSFVDDTQREPFFLMVSPLAPHVEVVLSDIFPTDDNNAPAIASDTESPDLSLATDPEALVISVADASTGFNGFALRIRPAPRHNYLIDGDLSNGEMPELTRKPSFNEADVSAKPSCPRPFPPLEPSLVVYPACIAERPLLREAEDIVPLTGQYKSMLASVIAIDDLLGSVVQSLTNSGKLDNTVIIFTSDNGWLYGEHRLLGKEVAYEESIRVPLFVRAPNSKTGVVSPEIVINNDIAPTLADFAGVTPPYDPDGGSIVPLVETAPTSIWHDRKRFMVERWYVPSLLRFDSPTYRAMRQLTATGQDVIFISSRTDPTQYDTPTHHEFYDITTDPYQLNNIPLPPELNQGLENFMLIFGACTGAWCRLIEAF